MQEDVKGLYIPHDENKSQNKAEDIKLKHQQHSKGSNSLMNRRGNTLRRNDIDEFSIQFTLFEEKNVTGEQKINLINAPIKKSQQDINPQIISQDLEMHGFIGPNSVFNNFQCKSNEEEGQTEEEEGDQEEDGENENDMQIKKQVEILNSDDSENEEEKRIKQIQLQNIYSQNIYHPISMTQHQKEMEYYQANGIIQNNVSIEYRDASQFSQLFIQPSDNMEKCVNPFLQDYQLSNTQQQLHKQQQQQQLQQQQQQQMQQQEQQQQQQQHQQQQQQQSQLQQQQYQQQQQQQQQYQQQQQQLHQQQQQQQNQQQQYAIFEPSSNMQTSQGILQPIFAHPIDQGMIAFSHSSSSPSPTGQQGYSMFNMQHLMRINQPMTSSHNIQLSPVAPQQQQQQFYSSYMKERQRQNLQISANSLFSSNSNSAHHLPRQNNCSASQASTSDSEIINTCRSASSHGNPDKQQDILKYIQHLQQQQQTSPQPHQTQQQLFDSSSTMTNNLNFFNTIEQKGSFFTQVDKKGQFFPLIDHKGQQYFTSVPQIDQNEQQYFGQVHPADQNGQYLRQVTQIDSKGQFIPQIPQVELQKRQYFHPQQNQLYTQGEHNSKFIDQSELQASFLSQTDQNIFFSGTDPQNQLYSGPIYPQQTSFSYAHGSGIIEMQTQQQRQQQQQQQMNFRQEGITNQYMMQAFQQMYMPPSIGSMHSQMTQNQSQSNTSQQLNIINQPFTYKPPHHAKQLSCLQFGEFDQSSSSSSSLQFDQQRQTNGGGCMQSTFSNPNLNAGGQLKGKKKLEIKEETMKYDIDLQRLEEDGRTTVYIKNIPNKYTLNCVLQTIQKNHKDNFDFFYLPIDFQNKCNVGYAFINFIKPELIREFFLEFNGKKWKKFNSDKKSKYIYNGIKICNLKYARIQGRAQLEEHFQNSSVMNQREKKFKPVFISISDLIQTQKQQQQQQTSQIMTGNKQEQFDNSTNNLQADWNMNSNQNNNNYNQAGQQSFNCRPHYNNQRQQNSTKNTKNEIYVQKQ